MLIFEAILDGVRDIKDHFGRTMLQLLGIILGAGSIVATFSLSVAGKSAAMEYYISSRHWLDALTTPLEQHLVQLADTVTLLLARAPGGAAPVAPVQAVRPDPAEIEEAQRPHEHDRPRHPVLLPSPRRGRDPES